MSTFWRIGSGQSSVYSGLNNTKDLIPYIIHLCNPAACFYLGIDTLLNLIEFSDIVWIRAPEPLEGSGSLVPFAFGDEVTWRVRHEAQKD